MVIGFVSSTKVKTLENFKTFTELNKEEIDCLEEDCCILKDNTVIKCIYKRKHGTGVPTIQLVDQIIISDTNITKTKIRKYLLDYDYILSDCVPPAFKIMLDNEE